MQITAVDLFTDMEEMAKTTFPSLLKAIDTFQWPDGRWTEAQSTSCCSANATAAGQVIQV